jgi:Tol biopolymer transport system component
LQTGHSRPIGHGDISFDISPDGETIVFNASGVGGRDLYLLHLPDSIVTRIAETADYEVAPTFTPDGLSIVYAAGMPGDRADHLFVRPVGGGPARQLTFADANDSSPQVSPDGSLVTFDRAKNYNWGGLAASWSDGGVICVMGMDGKNERQISPDETYAQKPWFLPDGQSVGYVTVDGAYSVRLDRSGSAKKLSDFNTSNEPTWSRDGRLLAFSRGETPRSREVGLFVADASGTDERRLIPKKQTYSRPIFSRDGTRLYVFVEEWPQGPTGTPGFQLWSVETDGKDFRRVASSRLFDAPLHWSAEQ